MTKMRTDVLTGDVVFDALFFAGPGKPWRVNACQVRLCAQLELQDHSLQKPDPTRDWIL